MTDTTVRATGVTLTDAAAAKATALLSAEGRDDLALPCSRAAAPACATS